MRKTLVLSGIFLILLCLVLKEDLTTALNDADVASDFGAPIPGLGEPELSLFQAGKEVFTRRFKRSEGLGPHFNAVSCVSCHEEPAIGGSSQRYRDFFLAGQVQPDGSFKKAYPDCSSANLPDQKSQLCLPSAVLPHYGPQGTIADPVAPGVEHPAVPPQADKVARRNAPPLFGVGLFRLVSDEEILSRADPDDADGDGISGRANFVSKEENKIGRFGYKCQAATIEGFNRGALQNQMGITSDSTEFRIGDASRPSRSTLFDDLFGIQTAHAQVVEPKNRIVDFDSVFDPEIRRAELLELIFFQENLAAPRRVSSGPAVQRGEAVFERIGCARCHAPSLSTSIGSIHPYTDLLIHDLGEELADGIVMEKASGSEFRTQPLWGLCRHAPFLHDGRADTVEQAIRWHGGEAGASRDRYQALDEYDQADLHQFLESL
ncbi:MAG: hypothetical protein HY717_20415 [Planctomycetes bacterium]|nr:hypothetical protein [Planctomycetota bacterium]